MNTVKYLYKSILSKTCGSLLQHARVRQVITRPPRHPAALSPCCRLRSNVAECSSFRLLAVRTLPGAPCAWPKMEIRTVNSFVANSLTAERKYRRYTLRSDLCCACNIVRLSFIRRPVWWLNVGSSFYLTTVICHVLYRTNAAHTSGLALGSDKRYLSDKIKILRTNWFLDSVRRPEI